jgi:hypothetical protein
VPTFDHDVDAVLREAPEPPCLSLYQPTHRHHPENQQDPIRYGNLLKELEASLGQAYPAREAEPLLRPFRALATDRAFWRHTHDGLAVLGAPGVFRVFRLQRPVPELAVVADSFHTKPLIRILQSADRFQVLAVNRQSIRLFEGNRDALDEIEPAEGVPRTITDALGDELTEPHLTVASYGGKGAASGTMVHGHGGKAAEVDSDAERFFRAVDRAITERHSQPTGLPLILAALPEHHPTFRAVSHNPMLVDGGIDVHPDALTLDELRERAWRVVEPRYRARIEALVDEFGAARARDLGDDDLGRVAAAILAGRVRTLLVEADRVVPGRVDEASAAIEPADLSHPAVDDVLDDLIALGVRTGARIVVVPPERMPTATGVAAIYRY